MHEADGDWQKGWALRLKARPWAVLVPKGAQVVRSVGWGARNEPFQRPVLPLFARIEIGRAAA